MRISNMPEGVELLVLDNLDTVKELWDKIKDISGLFDDYHAGRYDLFIQRLMSPDSVWLRRTDGNGIMYLTSVMCGLSATAHMVYWDKRLKGREEFTLDVLRYLMKEIPLRKVNVYLPDYAGAAKHFAQRLGLKREGCIRRWSHSRGNLFDMIVFGITDEEAFDGKYVRSDSDGVPAKRQGVHGSDTELVPDGDAGHTDPGDGSNGPVD